MEPKPLTLRPMPPINESLAQLRDAARFSSSNIFSRWQRNVFFTVAQRLMEQGEANQLTPASDWQNQTMTDAYLKGRESLALFSNISYLFEAAGEGISAIERASNLTRRALLFHQNVKSKSLGPEVESGFLLESEQYPYFFGTSRIPKESRDERFHAPDSRHFIVSFKGHFYRINVDPELPTCADLTATFQEIVRSHIGTQHKIGILTALPRPVWASIRRQLATSTVNELSLRSMDEALFLVALDLDYRCENRTDAMQNLIFGDFTSRWFDKSHQLIVFGDVTAGINRDHSFLDGHPTLRYVQFLNSEIDPRCPDSGKVLDFELIKWNCDELLSKVISDTELSLADEIDRFSIDTWDTHELGATDAKAFGLNADFIMQAAIHMACYKVFGRFINSTEAVHMRHTKSGRYDSILTLTPAMARLVSEFDQANPTERRQLIALGQDAHRERIRSCKQGKSPILHLTALLNSNIKFGPFSLKSDGIYWREQRRLLAAPWQDITSCTVTTSHPGARPGLECSGFTDTYPGVVGVSYLVKADRTTVYLKADNDKLGFAAPIKRELKLALTALMASAKQASGSKA